MLRDSASWLPLAGQGEFTQPKALSFAELSRNLDARLKFQTFHIGSLQR